MLLGYYEWLLGCSTWLSFLSCCQGVAGVYRWLPGNYIELQVVTKVFYGWLSWRC